MDAEDEDYYNFYLLECTQRKVPAHHNRPIN